MRRIVTSLLIVSALGLILPAGVAAAKLQGCSTSFTQITVDTDWQPGDPIPGPGQDAWWDLTLTGIAAEGLTVAQVATIFGQPSELAFYQLVVEGIREIDANGNGDICYKRFPAQQRGTELYFFLAQDDKDR